MAIVTINKKAPVKNNSFLTMGFRPFFFGGICFSVLSIALWTAVYGGNLFLPTKNFSIFQWHAHEMVYGYSLAIIAGFLLTAVANWTGMRTTNGRPLAIMFSCWALARVAMFFGSDYLIGAMVFDLAFVCMLIIELGKPIFKTKSYKQIGVLSKIVLLGIGNLIFYVSCFSDGLNVRLSVYGGLYLIVGVILTIGSRVYPKFVEAGLGLKGNIKNPKWIAISSLLLFVIFFINDLGPNNRLVLLCSTWTLFLITGYRLFLWYSHGIWQKPLLWGLYLAFVSISSGFLLFALSASGFNISPFLAIHAFAFGGIGFSTLSMIPRVTLGHTGRNVRTPPFAVVFPLVLLAIGTICRIILPIVAPNQYLTWISAAQIFWILAFTVLIFIVGRMFFMPRADGLAD